MRVVQNDMKEEALRRLDPSSSLEEAKACASLLISGTSMVLTSSAGITASSWYTPECPLSVKTPPEKMGHLLMCSHLQNHHRICT